MVVDEEAMGAVATGAVAMGADDCGGCGGPQRAWRRPWYGSLRWNTAWWWHTLRRCGRRDLPLWWCWSLRWWGCLCRVGDRGALVLLVLRRTCRRDGRRWRCGGRCGGLEQLD